MSKYLAGSSIKDYKLFFAHSLGKDLYEYLNDVYSKQAKYCVIFVSKSYIKNNWANHELKSAQSRALKHRSEYILPVYLDGSELPGILSTVGYLDAQSLKPYEVTRILVEKMKGLSISKVSIMQSDSSKGVRKLERTRHELFFVCGLSSSGKDSLLTDAARNYFDKRQAFFLTKYTSRVTRDSEYASSDSPLRATPYFVETVPASDLRDASKYYGTFEKYGNLYGFSQQELNSWLNNPYDSMIIAIYSATANLRKFRKEVTRITNTTIAEYAENNPNRKLEVYTHWILIDAPMDDCRSRNERRNLDHEILYRKRLEIRRDAKLIEVLKDRGFFDKERIIDNSDDKAFHAALEDFINCFEIDSVT